MESAETTAGLRQYHIWCFRDRMPQAGSSRGPSAVTDIRTRKPDICHRRKSGLCVLVLRGCYVFRSQPGQGRAVILLPCFRCMAQSLVSLLSYIRQAPLICKHDSSIGSPFLYVLWAGIWKHILGALAEPFATEQLRQGVQSTVAQVLCCCCLCTVACIERAELSALAMRL